jgi:hypothetical protein
MPSCNIYPKTDPCGIKQRRIYTSIFITVFAAITLTFGFLWNNKSCREGSDAPKPDQESKRGLLAAKRATESKAALAARSPKAEVLEPRARLVLGACRACWEPNTARRDL